MSKKSRIVSKNSSFGEYKSFEESMRCNLSLQEHLIGEPLCLKQLVQEKQFYIK